MIIEKTIIEYLIDAEIEGIGSNVFAEVPAGQLNKYITVEKTGSSRTDKLNTATIAIKSVSAVSLIDAAKINEAVKTAIDDIVFSKPIYRAALNTDYNFTNTNTKLYRYQAVYQIYY